MEIYTLEKTIMKYLLFLVHVQQSIKLSVKEKIKIFDTAKDYANLIFSNIQSYLANKNDYNSFDKNKFLSNAFNDIQEAIEKELSFYKKDITINNIDFSYYSIIDTLTNTKYAVSLNRNDLKQLLSYNELSGKANREKTEKKQLDDLRRRNEEEFYDLRKKAFQAMLHGNRNINPARYFDINDYILRNCSRDNIKYLHDQSTQTKEGIYFIETQGERIIKLKYEKRLIEYSFHIIDANDMFLIYIQGYIKINNSREEFYINEKYLNTQFGSVMNAFNLKKIIDLFNELGREEDDKGNDNDSNDIDNFLSGKIK
ncbi:MAG: hypothetical protein LBC88_04200 [Spirochaetaceae bacterium]|nr:hypothetical protein [Spirochaetaceae bacterium]